MEIGHRARTLSWGACGRGCAAILDSPTQVERVGPFEEIRELILNLRS